MFADILKQQNAQTFKMVTNVTQNKTKCRMKIEIAVKYRAYIGLRWSPIFDIYFQLWIMLQSFLIGRLTVVMATILEIQLHGFVRNVLIYHLPKYGENATFCFWVTFVTVFIQ